MRPPNFAVWCISNNTKTGGEHRYGVESQISYAMLLKQMKREQREEAKDPSHAGGWWFPAGHSNEEASFVMTAQPPSIKP